jgi:hypothetical protein
MAEVAHTCKQRPVAGSEQSQRCGPLGMQRRLPHIDRQGWWVKQRLTNLQRPH